MSYTCLHGTPHHFPCRYCTAEMEKVIRGGEAVSDEKKVGLDRLMKAEREIVRLEAENEKLRGRSQRLHDHILMIELAAKNMLESDV